MSGWWRARRDLARLLEDRTVSPGCFGLLCFVGLQFESERGGYVTTRDTLAQLFGVHPYTISRWLQRLSELELVENDLRQGQRRPFRLRLGAKATADPATYNRTSHIDPSSHVRSHFSQGDGSDGEDPLSVSGFAAWSTSHSSRAESLSLSEGVSSEGGLGTRETRDEGTSSPPAGESDEQVAARYSLDAAVVAEVRRAKLAPDVEDAILRARVASSGTGASVDAIADPSDDEAIAIDDDAIVDSFVDRLPTTPRDVDGVSERDFLAELVATFDATLVEEAPSAEARAS